MSESFRATRPTKKHVILFMAANPCDTSRLALDRQAQAIRVELERSTDRERFEFVTRWAPEPLDLLRELRRLKPIVVHFSGHGTSPEINSKEPKRDADVVTVAASSETERGGLVFDGANGGSQVVTPQAFARTLSAAGESVKLVVLNACYSTPLAEVLLAHVDCVVGMSGDVPDDATRSFAIGFYGGLGGHESVAAAFKQGTAAISLNGLPDADRPQLLAREAFDSNQTIEALSGWRDVPCPYPGMRPFRGDQAASFYGRASEIDELIDRLRTGEREIYVIGPSGSGKSSLVTAGILPRLARGIAGLGPAVVRTMRPGERPAVKLWKILQQRPDQPFVAADGITALLAERSPDAWLLLVIDQLEELFTQAKTGQRKMFLVALRSLRDERRCAVIFTLRADFFGAIMESELWPEPGRNQLSRIEVSPLRGTALREAITVPARAASVDVDPELLERLIADAASEPGTLPLLQEAMVQLWNKRVYQALTLADYEALGQGGQSGLAVALSRRGDAALRRFSAAQTEIARRILLRLISFGEGRSDTRRQQPCTQLRTAGDAATEFDFVLKTMVDDRLLTVDDDVAGEPRVDLAHEIMISAWPKLAEWIRSHRVDEQRRRRLEVAAVEWVERRRGLLDLVELANAEQWQHTESAVQLGHSAEVTAFITASRAAQTMQRRRRSRLLAGAFAVLFLFAVVVAVLAVLASSRANDVKLQLARRYMEQGQQLVLAEHYAEAAPYLLEARRNGLEDPSLRVLFYAAKRGLPLVLLLVEPHAEVRRAVFSPDGTRVLTISEDNTARVWDAATGKLTGALAHQGSVLGAVFSPDGTRVLTASEDKNARVWDAATGKPLTGALAHQGPVLSAAFSRDGTRVVTASEDKTARVWDAATGKPLTGALAHQAPVHSAEFSPDGTRVVTASKDNTARVWDAATGKPFTNPLAHQWWQVASATFSPDGNRVVTMGDDGTCPNPNCKTAQVWDAATGQPLTNPLEHQGRGVGVAFSPDGRRVVIASKDKTAQVWDALTGQPLTGPLEHQGFVWWAAFSPDGTRVVTMSGDAARVWDATTGKPLTAPLEHEETVFHAVFSPDGTRVVTTSGLTAQVWAAATDKLFTGPLEHQSGVRRAAFSPDGTRVVTASEDKTARVWDAATGQPVTPSLEHQDVVNTAAFSPDGTRVVTVSGNALDAGGTARVWDAATGQPVTPSLEHQHIVNTAAFSPDGTRVVTASDDNTARVWDAATGQPLTRPLAHQSWVVSAVFSPDGTRVVTASGDKTARVWDAATGQPVTPSLEHQGPVYSAAFSPDGTRVVTANGTTLGGPGAAMIWDAATGQPLTGPLKHRGAVRSASFSPDGTRVVTASADKTARVWDSMTGQPCTNPLEDDHGVDSASFSPDGTRVVTVSGDKAARVWDSATGQPWAIPLAHRGGVRSASFSPDGTRVVTASADKTAQVWDLRLDTGTLADWTEVVDRSPYILNEHGALVRRSRRSSTR